MLHAHRAYAWASFSSLAGEKKAGVPNWHLRSWRVKGHPSLPSSHCASESTTEESVTPAPFPCAHGTSSVPPACVVISSGSYTCTVNREIFVVKIFSYGLLAYEN